MLTSPLIAEVGTFFYHRFVSNYINFQQPTIASIGMFTTVSQVTVRHGWNAA